MATDRQKRIAEYMNARNPERSYTPFEVMMVEVELDHEKRERKKNKVHLLNTRTVEGKRQLNTIIAERVNEAISCKTPLTAEDIHLYKRCWADEYSDRTGKCSWGFKDVRRRLGYDPDTGYELKEA